MSDVPFLPAVKNLFDELGVSALPQAQREALQAKIATIVVQSVLIRCLDGLSDLQKQEFDIFMRENPNDPDGLYDFLKANIADFDDIVRDEVAKFRAEAEGFLKATQS